MIPKPPEKPTGRGREFGRDGISVVVDQDRALRAREISVPSESDLAAAEEVVAERLAAQLRGRTDLPRHLDGEPSNR